MTSQSNEEISWVKEIHLRPICPMMGDGSPVLTRERLRLHAEDIEVQHRRLVQLVNALRNAMEDDKNASAVSEATETLIDYLELHFSDEEEFMKEYHYPPALLESHLSDHHRILGTLRNVLRCIRSGVMRGDPDLPNSIHRWLEDHALAEDQPYVDYFRDEIRICDPESEWSTAESSGR